jgi:hypothetical protein
MVQPLTDSELRATPVKVVSGISLPEHDQVAISYDANGNPVQSVYRKSGVIVATVTVSYDTNGNPTSISKA